jgi:2-polyprenyl-6-hydroxyphenyl methylase/3-demethylubiquinone-9 3-methyltransferase
MPETPEAALAATFDPELDRVAWIFRNHGGTDFGYLAWHHARFRETKRIFEETHERRGQRVLDIGAHWLHQALLYAEDGYRVTAADFPITIENHCVKSMAAAYGIERISYENLETPTAFAAIPDGTFDVILFTEIIEHITFNPVAMWTELYRLLAPGGVIVVTTPNYYSVKGRAWALRRTLKGYGSALPVEEILRVPTYGPHWKEYSLRELWVYFTMLSPDFHIHKATYVDDYYKGPKISAMLRFLERRLPVLQRNLHIEVTLPSKEQGIVIAPTF